MRRFGLQVGGQWDYGNLLKTYIVSTFRKSESERGEGESWRTRGPSERHIGVVVHPIRAEAELVGCLLNTHAESLQHQHQENRAHHTRIRMSGGRSRRLGCSRNVIGRGGGPWRRCARRDAPDAWTSRLSSVGTQGRWARQSGAVRCKDVIHVLKRLKHREPAGAPACTVPARNIPAATSALKHHKLRGLSSVLLPLSRLRGRA